MAKWWTAIALAALSLAPSAGALAQPAGGPPPPYSGGPPGGGPPVGGPQGPPAPAGGGPVFADNPQPTEGPKFLGNNPELQRDFVIPFDTKRLPSNGFADAECGEPMKCFTYTGIGAMSLRRESPGNGVVAVRDPVGVDNGAQPPAAAPVAVDFNNLNPDYSWGVRGTLGRSEGPHCLELTGYYLFQNGTSFTAIAPSLLDVRFGAFTPPPGFAGNNNLWLQADEVRLQLQTTIANAELNYRFLWNLYGEVVVGLRYFYLREKFSIFTDDDGRRVGPNPLLTAEYAIRTENHIVGPQIGFELDRPLVPVLSVGMSARGMVGANFLRVHHGLVRGDGFLGPNSERHDVQLSSVDDVAVHLYWWLNEQVRLKLGYQGVWVLNVPDAPGQVNFNPNAAAAGSDNRSSIFFHGPFLEFQVAF